MRAGQDGALTRFERGRQVARVLWVILVLNWLVAALKFVLGLTTHCMTILADGLHSFSDGTSNIVGLIAITIASQPADKDHPYGHQKYETLASVVIAVFLFIVSFGILREAVEHLVHPTAPRVTAVSFGVMSFTLLVNLFVVWFERRKARQLSSDLLLSDSWHTLTDVFVTLTVFLALGGIALGIPHLDSVFSVPIAGVIVMTAVAILKRSTDVLVDRAVLDTGLVERIVSSVEGVRDCHEIRTRGRVEDVYLDLHVLVDNQMSVLKSHHLANVIESRICKEIPAVRDVVVHIEPVSHDHEELEEGHR